MIPTIDFGSIAVLGTLITIIKHIWSAVVNASTWLKNTFVIFVSSSKIWATAFFLTIVVFIVGYIQSKLSQVVGAVASYSLQSLVYDSAFDFEFGVINEIWDWSRFIALCTFILTFVPSVLLIGRSVCFIYNLIDKFTLYVRAWRT